MKNKIFLCIVVTIVALLGCLGMAKAQESIGSGTPPGEAQATLGSGRLADEGAPGVTPFAVTGWYYVHPAYCNFYYDGSTLWMYIYPAEGGSWVTDNWQAQNALTPACTTGNRLGFYVFNTNGNFNQVLVFPYK